MISVLIPVFNVDVTALLEQLHGQCLGLNIPFEIICLDDASDAIFKKKNEDACALLSFTKHISNELNLGRSASRNKLISEAKFEWVYMLDCDADVTDNPFLLKNYWNQKNANTILSGGRIYDSTEPVNAQYYLHWKWASKRELIDVEARMKNPVLHFLSNNFFFHKEIVQRIPFDKSLKGYGYEDTLWAAEITANGFEIKHIYNPVKHIGIESIAHFLMKIEESLYNLVRLQKLCAQKEIPFPVTSKLYQAGLFFVNLPFQNFINSIFLFLQKMSVNRLKKTKPMLFWLDVFRLSVFVTFKNKNNKYLL
jgi:glycosyltransferase involved in cell wall biosynthesis